MDPLSNVLQVVRLTGAYFYRVDASSPWSVSMVPATELTPRILPDSEHLIPYHIVASGTCWGGLRDAPLVRLQAGDVIMFPHGSAHYMSSGDRPWAAEDVRVPPGPYPNTVVLGNGTERAATLVCGFLGCEARPFNPLLAALPPCLHVAGGAGGWLGAFPRDRKSTRLNSSH